MIETIKKDGVFELEVIRSFKEIPRVDPTRPRVDYVFELPIGLVKIIFNDKAARERGSYYSKRIVMIADFEYADLDIYAQLLNQKFGYFEARNRDGVLWRLSKFDFDYSNEFSPDYRKLYFEFSEETYNFWKVKNYKIDRSFDKKINILEDYFKYVLESTSEYKLKFVFGNSERVGRLV